VTGRPDPETELAEREAWLDHVPEELEHAVGWVMGEWKRLRAVEAELSDRIRALEVDLAAAREELERRRGLRGVLRQLFGAGRRAERGR